MVRIETDHRRSLPTLGRSLGQSEREKDEGEGSSDENQAEDL
jgi:hypothetical protein